MSEALNTVKIIAKMIAADLKWLSLKLIFLN
jgi:hypothetical protein